jgi:mxaJ protein
MSSAISCFALFALSAGATCLCAAPPLRVCADPNNLPYSNEQMQGFENQIAALIAKDMGAPLQYYWFPQREKFFSKTLNSGMCDVVMGVPSGIDQAATTQPYYRSTYVFITRRDRQLHIKSFDDPRLHTLKIGVHILGEQDDSLPPVHSLVSRGIVRNLVGFSIFGNLTEKNPAADLIRAVEDGKVDVAIAWGPLAGYFGQHSTVPLDMTPVLDDPEHPDLPFHFDIGIGVRSADTALRQTLDGELIRQRPKIDHILRTFGIPQLNVPNEVARSTED